MKNQGAPWFRLDPAAALAQIHGMTDKQAGNWAKKLFCALIRADSAVQDEFARDMILEREEFIRKKATSGELGASRRWHRHSGAMANDGGPMASPLHRHCIAIASPLHRHGAPMANDGGPMPMTGQDNTRHIKTENEWGVSVDKYEKISGMDVEKLVAHAVEFCNESDPSRAAAGFKKTINRIGKEAFRDCLCRFVGSVESGEECQNRGATFFKYYLKPAMEAKIAREGAK